MNFILRVVLSSGDIGLDLILKMVLKYMENVVLRAREKTEKLYRKLLLYLCERTVAWSLVVAVKTTTSVETGGCFKTKMTGVLNLRVTLKGSDVGNEEKSNQVI